MRVSKHNRPDLLGISLVTPAHRDLGSVGESHFLSEGDLQARLGQQSVPVEVKHLLLSEEEHFGRYLSLIFHAQGMLGKRQLQTSRNCHRDLAIGAVIDAATHVVIDVVIRVWLTFG
jgi:hypothetical protein